jgi:hypothetical protein
MWTRNGPDKLLRPRHIRFFQQATDMNGLLRDALFEVEGEVAHLAPLRHPRMTNTPRGNILPETCWERY